MPRLIYEFLDIFSKDVRLHVLMLEIMNRKEPRVDSKLVNGIFRFKIDMILFYYFNIF